RAAVQEFGQGRCPEFAPRFFRYRNFAGGQAVPTGSEGFAFLRVRQDAVVPLAVRPLTLAVEDTTDVNYSSHKAKKGMGILGGPKGTQGINIHSVLAHTTGHFGNETFQV
ncbi:MAG: hypothetical protein ABMA02_12000, partial [Saprospiraceae bacterium]